MKKILCLLVCLPLCLFSQDENKGVTFETCTSWKQLVAKAKEQSKSILVDCYATWCGPCKAMDRDVFSLPEVAEYIAKHFIAIKIQMDKTAGDDENIKRWYSDAYKIQRTYAVNSFPTYLFFDSTGEATHRAVGYMTGDKFITEGKKALNHEQQYYTIFIQV